MRLLLILMAFILFVYACKRRNSFIFTGKYWGIVTAALFSLGLVFYYSEYLLVSASSTLVLSGYYISTAFGYLYLFIWFDRIFAFGFKNTLFTVAASLVLRGLLEALILLLQQAPSMFLLVLTPLASLPYLLRIRKETFFIDIHAANPSNMCFIIANPSNAKGRYAMASFFVILFLLAAILYLNDSQSTLYALDAVGLWKQWSCILINLAVGAFLYVIANLQFSKTVLMTFFLTLVALVCFGSFMQSPDIDFAFITTSLALSFVRKSLDFMVIFPAFIFSLQGECRFRWHAASRATLGLAQLITGYLLTEFIVLSSEDEITVLAIALLTLFLALIVHFICIDGTTTPTQPESALSEDDKRRPFKEALDRIAENAGLTPTEATILGLIARGHNADSVRQELVVSVNTAKTHIRNIYAKLNIHSQQELIALVNETKTSIMEEIRR